MNSFMRQFFTGAGIAALFLGVVVLLAKGCAGSAVKPGVEGARHEAGDSFNVLTDAGTGCQYLATGASGTAVPRLDTEGKHICKSK